MEMVRLDQSERLSILLPSFIAFFCLSYSRQNFIAFSISVHSGPQGTIQVGFVMTLS